MPQPGFNLNPELMLLRTSKFADCNRGGIIVNCFDLRVFRLSEDHHVIPRSGKIGTFLRQARDVNPMIDRVDTARGQE